MRLRWARNVSRVTRTYTATSAQSHVIRNVLMLLPPDRRGLPRGASAAVDIVRPSRRPAGLASGQAPQDEVDFWFPKKKVLMLRSPRQRASRSPHTESPARSEEQTS